MNKKILILLIAIVVAIIAIFGANLLKKEIKTTLTLTKVSVALDWFPYSAHAGLFVAKDRGYFAAEGLDVDLHTPSDPSTVLQTVSAGRDDFGINYQPDVLTAREKGVKVISIMALVQHPLNSVMTLKTSDIKEPKDLVGKKIGYPGIPMNESLLDAMLKSQGKSLEDVEMVNVGFDTVPALISNRVEAIIGTYWILESISAEKQGFPVNIMRMEQHGVPDYYELVLVTSEEKVSKNTELIQRFVRAVEKGYKDAISDPQAAIQIMKKLKPEVDLAIESKGADLVAPLWIPENKIFGWQEEKRWVDFANWMKENGLISKDLDIKAAFDNSFVENAAKGK